MPLYANEWIELTTVPGLEELLYLEAREKLGVTGGRVRRLGGRVYTPCRGCIGRVRRLTLAEHATILFSEDSSLRKAVSDAMYLIRQYVEGLSTFSVHAERITKELPATSVDIASEAGRIISEATGLNVSLDSPDIVFHVEYEAGTYRVGVRLTPHRGLRDRPYRLYVHPSALNPILAAAMCRLAGASSIYDPYCGSGTIPIECALGGSWKAVGSDVVSRHIMGAKVNASLAGVREKTEFFVAEATRIGVTATGVEAIVTNPPFGVREKAWGGLRKTYRSIFRVADDAGAGKVVVLTSKSLLLKRSAPENYVLEKKIHIIEGGLHAYVHVYRNY